MKKIIKFTSIVLSLAICLTVVTGNNLKVKAGTPTDILYDGGVYRIRNVATGLYLTVYNGTDANGTNVVQQPLNTSSNAQKWVLSFGILEGDYLYPMCSGNGYGRVLDISRGSSSLANGQNVQIWESNDPISQSWNIYIGNTPMSFSFSPRNKTDIALCVYGNGSGSTGTSSTSNGNVFMKTYSSTDTYQQWYLEYIEQAPTTPNMRISFMTRKFPTGKYWNHGTSSNNSDGTTSSPCTHHGNCPYNGSCGCNSFESSIQCLGFVKKLSDDIYQESYFSGDWLKSYDSSYLEHARSGDIIYKDGHAMMVEGKDGNGRLTVLECNWDNVCGIDRTRTITPGTTVSWIARSPFLWY